MPRLFKRREKALTASAEVVGGLHNGWNPIPLLGAGARERIQGAFTKAQSADYSWLYKRSPAVRMVVDTIVRNIGQLDLRLYEEISESERQARPDHPAALSMRYPSESTPADRLVRSLVKDWLLYDNAYALIGPAPSGKFTLERVPAFMMQVMGTQLFRAENYRIWPQGAWNTGYWSGSGTPVDVSPDGIWHWHGEDPEDPRVGYSRLDTLRGIIAEDVALQQANVELAQAGLQEPLWVYRPATAPDLDNRIKNALEEDLANRIKTRNRKPFVLEEGMEMRSFGVSPRDAEMMEVRRFAAGVIAAEYGLPLGMVGLDSNVEEARSLMYSDTLPPICEDFARMLNQRILVQIYDWPDGCFEFNLDEKLMGDDRIKTLVAATGRPVYLTNEARAKLNLPPVDGGDELVTPLNVIVGENPKPSPQVMAPQDPVGPPQDGSYRLDQGAAATPPKAIEAGEHKDYTPAEPLPRFHPRQRADMERQNRNVDRAQAVLQRHFNQVSRMVNGQKAAVDWESMDRDLAGRLRSYLRRAVETEGGIYAMKLGGGDFDMRQVEHYLDAMSEGAAAAINDTLRGDITDMGAKDALARAPQHVASGGASLGVKATLFARSEAAKQSPGYQQRVKTWIADSGRHAEFDGLTVAIEDGWPSGFAPGGEAGCRCTASIS